MSRLHVHLHVRDLDQSVRFYNALFGSEPTRVEHGYAKWMLDDPRVNFAISTGGEETGVGHLGIEAEAESELAGITARARQAAGEILIERGARCCYAAGNKAWADDPQGVRWEAFHSTGGLGENEEGADETYIERADGTKAKPRSPAACGCGCGSRKESAKAGAQPCCA